MCLLFWFYLKPIFQVSDEPTYSEAITMSTDVKLRYSTTHQNSEIQAKSRNPEDVVETKIQFPDRSNLQDQNRFYGGVRSSKLKFRPNRIYGILLYRRRILYILISEIPGFSVRFQLWTAVWGQMAEYSTRSDNA